MRYVNRSTCCNTFVIHATLTIRSHPNLKITVIQANVAISNQSLSQDIYTIINLKVYYEVIMYALIIILFDQVNNMEIRKARTVLMFLILQAIFYSHPDLYIRCNMPSNNVSLILFANMPSNNVSLILFAASTFHIEYTKSPSRIKTKLCIFWGYFDFRQLEKNIPARG